VPPALLLPVAQAQSNPSPRTGPQDESRIGAYAYRAIFRRSAFRISDLSDERWRTLPSGAFASFLPFFLFEHGLVKISRDGFGDRFVGDCGRVFVFAGVHQQSNGLSLFVIG
jgi:hypothetical protein